jgi:hypothetical protein
MANRYWVGDGGNWSDTAHWSASSGGAGGASLPASADDVFFDANSFSIAGQSVNITGTSVCRDMDWTGATNTPNLSSSSGNLQLFRNLVTISDMTWTATVPLYLRGVTSINTNGLSLGSYIYSFVSFVSLDLLSDLTILSNTGFYFVSAGTVNTNNFNITTPAVNVSDSTVRTLNLGSSTITVSINWTGLGSNLTVNAGTSKIVMTGNNRTFNGDGLTFYNLQCTGTPITITGSNTFNKIIGTALKTIRLTTGTTTKISDIDAVGATIESTTTTNATLDLQYLLLLSELDYINFNYIEIINGRWKTPKTDWTTSDYMNADPDVNRIESNIGTLEYILNDTFGKSLSLTNKTDWDNTDIPYYDELNRIEDNINTLETNWVEPTGWETPKTDWVTGLVKQGSNTDGADMANRMENNLLLLYNSIEGTADYLLPCGTFKAGSDHIRQHFTRS